MHCKGFLASCPKMCRSAVLLTVLFLYCHFTVSAERCLLSEAGKKYGHSPIATHTREGNWFMSEVLVKLSKWSWDNCSIGMVNDDTRTDSGRASTYGKDSMAGMLVSAFSSWSSIAAIAAKVGQVEHIEHIEPIEQNELVEHIAMVDALNVTFFRNEWWLVRSEHFPTTRKILWLSRSNWAPIGKYNVVFGRNVTTTFYSLYSINSTSMQTNVTEVSTETDLPSVTAGQVLQLNTTHAFRTCLEFNQHSRHSLEESLECGEYISADSELRADADADADDTDAERACRVMGFASQDLLNSSSAVNVSTSHAVAAATPTLFALRCRAVDDATPAFGVKVHFVDVLFWVEPKMKAEDVKTAEVAVAWLLGLTAALAALLLVLLALAIRRQRYQHHHTKHLALGNLLGVSSQHQDGGWHLQRLSSHHSGRSSIGCEEIGSGLDKFRQLRRLRNHSDRSCKTNISYLSHMPLSLDRQFMNDVFQDDDEDDDEDDVGENGREENGREENGRDDVDGLDAVVRFSRSDIIFDGMRSLGCGNYGYVFNGMFCYGTARFQVAIKQSLSDDPASQKDLLSEAQKLSKVADHGNIVSLLGITSEKKLVQADDSGNPGQEKDKDTSPRFVEKYFLIFTLYTSGNMESFFEKNKYSLHKDDPRLKAWAQQIANGMDYLSSKGIVHLDLAIRNVLLTHPETIAKISDFGLSKFQHELKDPKCLKPKSLPLLWLPLDVWRYGSLANASSATDVWSFGVLLWEIFTLGQQRPYQTQMAPREAAYQQRPSSRQDFLAEFLESGNRLASPWPEWKDSINEQEASIVHALSQEIAERSITPLESTCSRQQNLTSTNSGSCSLETNISESQDQQEPFPADLESRERKPSQSNTQMSGESLKNHLSNRVSAESLKNQLSDEVSTSSLANQLSEPVSAESLENRLSNPASTGPLENQLSCHSSTGHLDNQLSNQASTGSPKNQLSNQDLAVHKPVHYYSRPNHHQSDQRTLNPRIHLPLDKNYSKDHSSSLQDLTHRDTSHYRHSLPGSPTVEDQYPHYLLIHSPPNQTHQSPPTGNHRSFHQTQTQTHIHRHHPIYRLMLHCWQLSPLMRPTFAQLKEALQDQMNPECLNEQESQMSREREKYMTVQQEYMKMT